MSTAAGQRGEQAACSYLQRHGYNILARNVRLARGELDIIARKQQLLIFIEVKTHRNRESALLAVTTDKCRRLQSAANAWLGQHAQYATLQCRFDLIMLTPRDSWLKWPTYRIEHIRDIIR